jgi:hypothetical protein
MTIGIKVTVKGLDELIEKFGNATPLIQRELKRGMFQSVNAIRSEVIPLTPVGVSGRLRGSIGSSVSGEGFSIVGKVGSSLKDTVYPAVMEFGRAPGSKMPPPDALLRWVHLVVHPGKKNELSVAWQIARSIGIKGIKGRHYLQRGFDAAKGKIEGYFQQARDRIVEALNK